MAIDSIFFVLLWNYYNEKQVTIFSQTNKLLIRNSTLDCLRAKINETLMSCATIFIFYLKAQMGWLKI